MYARIKAAVARAEMERKSARQSAAQRQRAMQGRAPKGMRPLGYAVDGEVIPHEAEAVRAIYDLFTRIEHPESLRSLARALGGSEKIDDLSPLPKHTHIVSVERAAARERQGLEPRPIVEDGPWSPSTVLGILRNPRYAALSTYTPKLAQADGKRRRMWKPQILRDDAGEPIRGQWEQIVDDETWWKAQQVLDDTERVTNTSGSTKRKHLGSGLYRCGYADEETGEVCGRKVTGAPRGYKCAGHIVRSGAAIDDFVMTVIAKRLARKDARVMVELADGGPQTAGIDSAISDQRVRNSAPLPEGLIRAVAERDGFLERDVVSEIGRRRWGVPHDNSRQLELSGDGGIVVRLLSRSPCAMLHWALSGLRALREKSLPAGSSVSQSRRGSRRYPVLTMRCSPQPTWGHPSPTTLRSR
ncbi:recombinase family protein [Propioniferax innocua]|uniref:recombinase family protein n=1 Tax=Propioniferax innocua TaxID=1753 RepID=UPI001FEBD996|nr:recombinase family protein [Propioniferax innocua]